jgi:hypothetical protein
MKRLRTSAAVCLGLLVLGWLTVGNGVDTIRSFQTGYSRICTFTAPDSEARIDIYTKTFWEIAPPLYYEVTADGQVVVPKCFFGSFGPEQRLSKSAFTMASREKGNLIGIAYSSHPSTLVVLHNLATQETWPGGTEESGPTTTRGLRMLAALKQETGRPGLTLSKR